MDIREHFPFRFKIRNKIIIPFAVISVAATLLGVEAVSDIFRAKLLELVASSMQRSAVSVGVLLRERFGELESVGRILVAGQPSDGEGSALSPEVLRALAETGIEAEIIDGAAGPPEGGVVLSGEGESPLLGLLREHSGRGPVLFALAPCGDGTRSVLLHEPLERRFLDSITESTGLEAALFDPVSGQWRGRGGEPPGSLPAPTVGGTTTGQLSSGRDTVTYTMFPLGLDGTEVVQFALMRPNDDLERWSRAIRRDIILAGLLFVSAVVLIYAVMIKRITRPIYQLMEAADRVGAGDLSMETGVRTRDEIGRLAETLDRMTVSLRDKQRQVQEATHKVIHQERLASLGQMIAAVMHEIKNPLNSLGIMVRLAEGEQNEEERASYFMTMDEEIRRISREVERLLAISRRPRFALEKTSVNRRVSMVMERLGPLIGSAGVKVVTRLAEGLPELLLEEGHLDQVLYNLIFNAVQAMAGGGELTVSTEGTDRAGGGGRWVVILVADTGEGIAPGHLERVFDPFFTSKPAEQGTGLGLSIVKSIIEGYGGRVTIRSELGKGTTAEVRLPF